jgi:hypothetical protein
MAWLAFEEPIRRRACMLIFKKREKKACMQRSQCKSRYRGKDGWAHKKRENDSICSDRGGNSTRERDQGLQGLPPKAVPGFEKPHDFVGGE